MSLFRRSLNPSRRLIRSIQRVLILRFSTMSSPFLGNWFFAQPQRLNSPACAAFRAGRWNDGLGGKLRRAIR